MFDVIIEILFWVSLLAILHSYLFYPVLMHVLSVRKKNNEITYKNLEEMPHVSVIMAVRNAEKVVAKKIRSVFECGYGDEKISFFIGSDASTDKTDQIIQEFAQEFTGIYFKRFEQRCGKILIINELSKLAISEILIFTDVHAYLQKGAIENLVKHFCNPEIKVVGGRLQNLNLETKGIAYQENSFIEKEFNLKFAESKIWGTMIGANGAFYAVRKNSFFSIPDNFIVDDFYISLKPLENGGKAICEPEAVVFENVTGSLYSEFVRKTRISTGNFQNLKALFPLLFSKNSGLAFSFFSHKLLRWIGPIFILVIIFTSIILWQKNLFYTIFFIIIMLSLTVPLIDYFSRKIQIHVIILRFITHFYYMNLALLIGLFKFMKGVKTNVWEPTKRE